jgi:hypothetical protein
MQELYVHFIITIFICSLSQRLQHASVPWHWHTSVQVRYYSAQTQTWEHEDLPLHVHSNIDCKAEGCKLGKVTTMWSFIRSTCSQSFPSDLHLHEVRHSATTWKIRLRLWLGRSKRIVTRLPLLLRPLQIFRKICCVHVKANLRVLRFVFVLTHVTPNNKH